MDCLPRDVQNIVWRLIRNDLYGKIVRQFKSEYVPHFSSFDCYLYVAETICIRANWRGRCGVGFTWNGTPIYNIRRTPDNSVSTRGTYRNYLPKNYI